MTTMRSACSTVARRWAMMIVVRSFIEVLERFLHEPLVLGVQRAGRLVEQQDRRILQDGPRNGDALALAAGQPGAALAEEGVVALRQFRDELVGHGRPGRGLEFRVAWRRAARSGCSPWPCRRI